jgi:hypothetical protein
MTLSDGFCPTAYSFELYNTLDMYTLDRPDNLIFNAD